MTAVVTTVTATVRPASLAEAHEAIRAGAPAGQVLLIRGGGTALDWGASPTRTDLVVDTTALDAVVAHNPHDMTVAVGAGMPLARLQELLAPHGQWLAFDPPLAAHGATLGGLLATGDAGPHRLAHGSLRDLVIGITVVLPDGAVARAGGHVIKNVAGYDLAKLFWGSLGTLGLVAELVLRLHPRPAASRTLATLADAATASAASRTLLASPLEPAAVEWDGERLLTLFDGTGSGVSERAAAAARLVGGDVLAAGDAATAWRALADATVGADGDTVVRAGTRPDRLPAVAAELARAGHDAGVTAGLLSSTGVGAQTARLSGGDAAGHAGCLDTWRSAVLGIGGTVTLRRRRDGVEALVPAWGPPPPTAALLRRVKAQFDPDDRCAPGRLSPWF